MKTTSLSASSAVLEDPRPLALLLGQREVGHRERDRDQDDRDDRVRAEALRDVGREEADDHLAEGLHLALDGVGRDRAELAVDALPGWNTKASPSASTTPRALLSSSQKIERRPMVRSFASPPSDVIDETIVTRISGRDRGEQDVDVDPADRVDRVDVLARDQADRDPRRQGEQRDEAEVQPALAQPPDPGPADRHRRESRQRWPIHVHNAVFALQLTPDAWRVASKLH